MMLFFQDDQNINNCDPDMVDVAVVGEDQMQLIGDSPDLSEIATGMWHHISTLAFQDIPSRLAKMRMKSNYSPSSPGSLRSPHIPLEEEEGSHKLTINPDTVLASDTHQADPDSLRIARIVVAVREATGKSNLVAVVTDSSGLGPGAKR